MKTSIITIIVLGVLVVGYAIIRQSPGTAVLPSPKTTASASSHIKKSPTPTVTPSISPTSTPTPTPSVEPTAGQTQTATPTPTVTVSVTPSSQMHTVTMTNFAFSPSAITVTRGDLVVFQAVDTFYSITILGRSSGRLQPGQQWTLNTGEFSPGTYQVYDSVHTIMRGTLTIQ